jgi:hypothetical protein
MTQPLLELQFLPIPQKEATREIKFAQVASTMTTSAKVQIPFGVNTISIHPHDD